MTQGEWQLQLSPSTHTSPSTLCSISFLPVVPQTWSQEKQPELIWSSAPGEDGGPERGRVSPEGTQLLRMLRPLSHRPSLLQRLWDFLTFPGALPLACVLIYKGKNENPDRPKLNVSLLAMWPWENYLTSIVPSVKGDNDGISAAVKGLIGQHI